MALTEDERIEILSHGSQNDPWNPDDIEEFVAVASGEAWVIIT